MTDTPKDKRANALERIKALPITDERVVTPRCAA